MKSLSRSLVKSLAVKGAVAAAAIAACASASAVSTVTLDTSKIVGAPASMVSFDTLEVLDYAVVTAVGSTFTESGLLNVTTFVNAGATSKPTGYGLYVSFSAMGTGNVLTALDYTVYGYAGAPATFAVTSAGATTSATSTTTLASGSLIVGPTNVYGAIIPVFASLVANTLTFSDSADAFSPVLGATASFINSGNQLGNASATGFTVTAGSGTINLVPAAVPEPETYALMLGGLAAVGFVARRRSNT